MKPEKKKFEFIAHYSKGEVSWFDTVSLSRTEY